MGLQGTARTSTAALMLRTTNLARLCGVTGTRVQGSCVATRLLRTSSSGVMIQTCLENARKSGSRWNLLFTPGAFMFVTAVVLASSKPQPAEAGWWPFSGWGKRERELRSHFDDAVPREGKKQRARAEAEMRAYLEKMRVPVQELMTALREGKVSREEFNHNMSSLNNEVELETHRIIFGAQDPPDARRRFEAEHGKCRYTPEAIKVAAALSPLVEIGADRGQWQRALVAQGATVVSYAPWAVPPNSYHKLPPQIAPVGTVLPGDETAIRQHQDKTLLLVYPPPDDMALRCLQEYRGDALVYVGEGRGGVNACDDFFDRLDAEWEVVTVMELDPFPQCFEKLFVLRRNRVQDKRGCASEGANDEAAGAA